MVCVPLAVLTAVPDCTCWSTAAPASCGTTQRHRTIAVQTASNLNSTFEWNARRLPDLFDFIELVDSSFAKGSSDGGLAGRGRPCPPRSEHPAASARAWPPPHRQGPAPTKSVRRRSVPRHRGAEPVFLNREHRRVPPGAPPTGRPLDRESLPQASRAGVAGWTVRTSPSKMAGRMLLRHEFAADLR
jgi:hypothetical protein